MTRLLLEAGGQVEDPPVPQYRGCPSPAMTAALHGEDTVLQHLLSSGAKSDKVTLSSTDLSLRGRERSGPRFTQRHYRLHMIVGHGKDLLWLISTIMTKLKASKFFTFRLLVFIALGRL